MNKLYKYFTYGYPVDSCIQFIIKIQEYKKNKDIF